MLPADSIGEEGLNGRDVYGGGSDSLGQSCYFDFPSDGCIAEFAFSIGRLLSHHSGTRSF